MNQNKLKMIKEKLANMPSIGKKGHWSSMSFSDEILEDALIKHVLGLVYYQMADVGEVFETTCQISDNTSWIDAWAKTADKLEKRAKNTTDNVTKENSYLRASTYWRISTMIFDDVNDEKIVEYSKKSQMCYGKYLKLSDYPGDTINMPYEDSFLPGHFYKSPVASGKAPLLIITPGRDTWAEDTRWVYDAALKRGIHCLVYDGPGQGFALRLNGITFRHDIENVITPIIDYALENYNCVDENNIILMGMSFGGFLVPRAAAYDKRVKLVITDPGNISWGGGIIQKLEIIKEIPKNMRPSQLDFMLEDYMWKHGVGEDELIDELKKFDNTSLIDEMTAKTLVLDGTSEINKGKSKKFYDMLKCEKDYILFDEESSAQMHTQMGGYATASEIIFDWILKNI